MDRQAKLARLWNRGTRYEIAIKKDGESYLLLYAYGSGNRRALMDAISRRGLAIVKLTGATEYKMPDRGAPLEVELNGWKAKFTGRTQREAIMFGEYPFIEDLFAAPVAEAA